MYHFSLPTISWPMLIPNSTVARNPLHHLSSKIDQGGYGYRDVTSHSEIFELLSDEEAQEIIENSHFNQ